MTQITGFLPLLGDAPRVLVLGSMPGEASLAQQQYYGHARNAFWPIMGELFDAGPEQPYAQRCEQLVVAGVAVWDVLATCCRVGSLDAAINLSSANTNDLASLLGACPDITHIYFNGRMAESIYRRRLLPEIQTLHPWLIYAVLPSSSPAMAGLDFAAKLERWRCIAVALGKN